MDWKIEKKEGQVGVYIISYLSTQTDVNGDSFQVVDTSEEKTLPDLANDIMMLKAAIQVVQDKITTATALK